ncbi:MAG: hypothetical protein H7Z74_13405 [Anaerolineae bacterium]|nr:hypothetical protein [Gemmatimonadaceae bacterium]
MPRLVWFISGACLLLPPSVRAQNSATAAVFLRLPASTRALALGNVYPAQGGDEAAIFYNPGQLAGPNKLSAGMSVQRHIQSTRLATIAARHSLGAGVVGIGIHALDYGTTEEIAAEPAGGLGSPTGQAISATDFAAALAYAVKRGRFRAGGSVKVVRQQIAGSSGGTGALDAGVAVDFWKDAGIAISVNNIGGRITLSGTSAPIPETARLGIASPSERFGPLRARAVAEVVHERGQGAGAAGGAEMAWTASESVVLQGRVGASARRLSAASPISFGGGLEVRNFALDYAYQDFAALGATHRVGVRWWAKRK